MSQFFLLNWTMGDRFGFLFCLKVSFERANKAEDGSQTVKHVKRMLYHRMNVLPQKKVMTFNRHTDDFNFHASYTDLDFLSEDEQRWWFFCHCFYFVFRHSLYVTELNKFRRTTVEVWLWLFLLWRRHALVSDGKKQVESVLKLSGHAAMMW